MTVVARALTQRRLAKESATLSLLRSPLAPVVLGFLAEHFPTGSGPRGAADIYELFDADLKALRAEGFDLPKGPQGYITDWVKAGWVIRKPGTARTGETLEPSEAALVALETVERWSTPRSTVTASRIQSIAQSLQSLARDSDPDSSSRLAQLHHQRDQITALIEATERGYYEVLTDIQISERINDILDQASSIPADFARVRGEIEELNRTLRRQLLDPDSARGDVLAEVFRGVDLIAESDAGRSFLGFYSVLLDRELSAHIDGWVADILSRDQAQHLPVDLKQSLRQLFRDMEAAGFEVNTVMTTLARSLRDYVRSNDFAENRRMVELLRQTRVLGIRAVEAANLSPIAHMGVPLTKIGMSISSVSALSLKNPGEEYVEGTPMPITEVTVDIDSLLESVRASEIDFAELHHNVARVLQTQPTATIGQVLEHYPASQGLASIVGLLYLAMSKGEHKDKKETVTWETEGVRMRASIDCWQLSQQDVDWE